MSSQSMMLINQKRATYYAIQSGQNKRVVTERRPTKFSNTLLKYWNTEQSVKAIYFSTHHTDTTTQNKASGFCQNFKMTKHSDAISMQWINVRFYW